MGLFYRYVALLLILHIFSEPIGRFTLNMGSDICDDFIGLINHENRVAKHVNSKHTPDLFPSSRYFLIMEAESFRNVWLLFSTDVSGSPGTYSCREKLRYRAYMLLVC
jgi:hypothetical protein